MQFSEFHIGLQTFVTETDCAKESPVDSSKLHLLLPHTSSGSISWSTIKIFSEAKENEHKLKIEWKLLFIAIKHLLTKVYFANQLFKNRNLVLPTKAILLDELHVEQPLLCLIKRNQIVHLLPLVLPIFVRTNWNWLLPDISLSLSPFYYFNLSCLLLVFTSLILSSRRFFVVPLVLILPPFFCSLVLFGLWPISSSPPQDIFIATGLLLWERDTKIHNEFHISGLRWRRSEGGPARSDGVREGSSEVCRSVYMTSFYFYFTEHVTNLHTGAKPFAGYSNSVREEPIVVATSCVMDSQSDNTLKVGSNLWPAVDQDK